MKYLSQLTMAFLLLAFTACKKDDEPKAKNLGTFNGNLDVSVTSPTTQLGDLLNADVTVSITGNNATIMAKGTPNFERTYTGTVSSNVGTTYIISVTQQTKPTEKIVAGNVSIMDNGLTFDVTHNGDAIEAIDDSKTVTITGNVRVTGSTLVKK